MPDAATTAPAAGWYADPAGGGGQRWWDGARWSDSTIARPPSALVVPPPPPAESDTFGRAAATPEFERPRAANPVQNTGPQPSFGGYVAISTARTGLVTGVVMLLVVVLLAGLVAGVIRGIFTVPWPLPIHEQAWMWGALVVALQLAAAIVALVVAVRGRASTLLGLIALVVAVLTAGGVAYLQWGAGLLS